jgi:hypothetical protein
MPTTPKPTPKSPNTATPKQVQLFGELVERKQFPDGTDTATLTAQFPALTRKNASAWIDRALALPNLPDQDDDGEDVPPPF